MSAPKAGLRFPISEIVEIIIPLRMALIMASIELTIFNFGCEGFYGLVQGQCLICELFCEVENLVC